MPKYMPVAIRDQTGDFIRQMAQGNEALARLYISLLHRYEERLAAQEYRSGERAIDRQHSFDLLDRRYEHIQRMKQGAESPPNNPFSRGASGDVRRTTPPATAAAPPATAPAAPPPPAYRPMPSIKGGADIPGTQQFTPQGLDSKKFSSLDDPNDPMNAYAQGTSGATDFSAQSRQPNTGIVQEGGTATKPDRGTPDTIRPGASVRDPARLPSTTTKKTKLAEFVPIRREWLDMMDAEEKKHGLPQGVLLTLFGMENGGGRVYGNDPRRAYGIFQFTKELRDQNKISDADAMNPAVMIPAAAANLRANANRYREVSGKDLPNTAEYMPFWTTLHQWGIGDGPRIVTAALQGSGHMLARKVMLEKPGGVERDRGAVLVNNQLHPNISVEGAIRDQSTRSAPYHRAALKMKGDPDAYSAADDTTSDGAPPRPPADVPSQPSSGDTRGSNPRLVAAIRGGASLALPQGYTVQQTSGYRPGDSGYHGRREAADFKIVRPDGTSIRNKGEDTTGLYTRVARGVKTWVAENDPGFQVNWGGAHSTMKRGGSVPDLMHYDTGRDRGQLRPSSRMSNLRPLGRDEYNAPEQGRRQVADAATAETHPQTGKPIIRNADGGISTERTITVEMDGKHYNIPTIVNGRQVTNDQAIAATKAGRNEPVGVYNTREEAVAAAQSRSAELGRTAAPTKSTAYTPTPMEGKNAAATAAMFDIGPKEPLMDMTRGPMRTAQDRGFGEGIPRSITRESARPPYVDEGPQLSQAQPQERERVSLGNAIPSTMPEMPGTAALPRQLPPIVPTPQPYGADFDAVPPAAPPTPTPNPYDVFSSGEYANVPEMPQMPQMPVDAADEAARMAADPIESTYPDIDTSTGLPSAASGMGAGAGSVAPQAPSPPTTPMTPQTVTKPQAGMGEYSPFNAPARQRRGELAWQGAKDVASGMWQGAKGAANTLRNATEMDKYEQDYTRPMPDAPPPSVWPTSPPMPPSGMRQGASDVMSVINTIRNPNLPAMDQDQDNTVPSASYLPSGQEIRDAIYGFVKPSDEARPAPQLDPWLGSQLKPYIDAMKQSWQEHGKVFPPEWDKAVIGRQQEFWNAVKEWMVDRDAPTKVKTINPVAPTDPKAVPANDPSRIRTDSSKPKNFPGQRMSEGEDEPLVLTKKPGPYIPFQGITPGTPGSAPGIPVMPRKGVAAPTTTLQGAEAGGKKVLLQRDANGNPIFVTADGVPITADTQQEPEMEAVEQ